MKPWSTDTAPHHFIRLASTRPRQPASQPTGILSSLVTPTPSTGPGIIAGHHAQPAWRPPSMMPTSPHLTSIPRGTNTWRAPCHTPRCRGRPAKRFLLRADCCCCPGVMPCRRERGRGREILLLPLPAPAAVVKTRYTKIGGEEHEVPTGPKLCRLWLWTVAVAKNMWSRS